MNETVPKFDQPIKQNPTGKYTNVSVNPIQHQSGSLSNGTATLNENGVLSCGSFESQDQPAVGTYYNISGAQGGTTYQFPGWKCVSSGPTSDFKAK